MHSWYAILGPNNEWGLPKPAYPVQTDEASIADLAWTVAQVEGVAYVMQHHPAAGWHFLKAFRRGEPRPPQ